MKYTAWFILSALVGEGWIEADPDTGKVYSYKGRGFIRGGRREHPVTLVGIVNKDGYRMLTLSYREWQASVPAHVVVWYFSNRQRMETGHHIDHINGNKLDNRLCNLEAVTAGENLRRYIRSRQEPWQPTAKLNEEQAKEIIQLRCVQKLAARTIAQRIGISESTVKMVALGHSWKHLERPL